MPATFSNRTKTWCCYHHLRTGRSGSSGRYVHMGRWIISEVYVEYTLLTNEGKTKDINMWTIGLGNNRISIDSAHNLPSTTHCNTFTSNEHQRMWKNYEEFTVFPIGITDPCSVSLVNSTEELPKTTRKYGNTYDPKLLPSGWNGMGISLPIINSISPVGTTTTNTRTHREVEWLHLELIAYLWNARSKK